MSRKRRQWLVSLHRWLREHDQRMSFTVLYITLALVLSMAISMFWLVAVVAAHGALEYWKLGRTGPRDQRLGRTLWHIRLDIMLVLAALWLGLYIDLLFGIAGLGAAARTGAQVSARVVAWQRTLRGVLLSVDEAALAAKAALGRDKVHESPATSPRRHTRPPWQQRWSWGDRITVAAAALFATLIVLTPILTEHDLGEALAILAQDLHPWPKGTIP